MPTTRFLFLLPILAATTLCAGRTPVATYSQSDAARAYGEGCGKAPRAKVRVHRDPTGSMLTLVAEKQGEAVIYAQNQSCNELQDDVVDVWRQGDGTVAGMLIDRGDGLRLLIGEHAELRGKRFDIERSGQYLAISQGTSSSLSSVAKPYIKLADIGLDVHRLFARKGALLAVGDNALSGRLEGRTIRIGATGITVDPIPVAIADMPAGIRVLDYAEESDDLLLAGMGSSGQASFVSVNLGTGRSAAIEPLKSGDDMALFVKDNGLRARLSGVSAAAQPASSGPRNDDGKSEKKGWLRF